MACDANGYGQILCSHLAGLNVLLLELVLDPAEPTHQVLAARLQQALGNGEHLRLTPWPNWKQGHSRTPGSQGEDPITLLLVPARWLESRSEPPTYPIGALVVAELCEGAARELGPGAALEAPSRGDPASRFGVFEFESGPASQLRCVSQLVLPSLSRWRRHQRRCLLALADTLIWWLRLCEQRQQLLRIAPLEKPLPLLPAAAAPLGLRLQSRRRWLQAGVSRRLSRLQPGSEAAWQIAVGRLEPSSQEVQILHQLPPQGGDWFADPFLLAEGENLWLLCERWQAGAGKGVIDLFAVRPEGLCAYGTVIEEPFHLSFPRVVHHNGIWFATVESASAAEVRLYRTTSFPTHWRLERVLLRGQSWIDPILIPAEDGGWWLLVNSHNCTALPGATAAELHLFHSADLLVGTFEPHPCSPLLVDSTCGRNGGLLAWDGAWIRVGQWTGIDNAYGQNVELRIVENLDRQRYQEKSIQKPWLQRLRHQVRATHLHTVNNQGHWITFDYVNS